MKTTIHIDTLFEILSEFNITPKTSEANLNIGCVSKRKPIRYKCLLCGRDKFTRPTPHKCIAGYRRRGLKWEQIYD